MKNSFKYLGLIGFLGLIGLVTDNPGFYGFFGFFAFFAYNRILPDERFKLNINKAAKNAFIAGLILFPLASTFAAFSSKESFTSIYTIAYSLNFALQVLVFSFSLTYYEQRGDV